LNVINKLTLIGKIVLVCAYILPRDLCSKPHDECRRNVVRDE